MNSSVTPTRSEERAGSHPGLDVGLFAVSATILTLEILQTKIFAFTLDPVTIYVAIGFCMLGLGASATMLSLRSSPIPSSVGRPTAILAAVGAVAVIVSHALFAHLSREVVSGGWQGFVGIVALTAPYFFLGAALTLLLAARGAAIGRAYAINLAGSGLGCLLVFPLLDRLGAERALLVVAAMGMVAAVVLSDGGWQRRCAALAGALFVLLAADPRGAALFPFRPDPSGQVDIIQRQVVAGRQRHPGERLEVVPVFSRWDRTARIDVYHLDTSVAEFQSRIGAPIETYFFAQDGSAGSFLVGVHDDLARARELYERTLYGAGYVARPVHDALVIGLGGAPDVQSALFHGVRRIDAVDINRATIEMARGPFREFLGDPYGRPGVQVHRMDGRAFLRQGTDTYDLIQLSGVDTKAVYAAGMVSVNENYMYTREAAEDMLRRLKPEGMVAHIRAGLDVHRLSTIAVAALRRLGEPAPERHVFAITQGLFCTLLIKRTPFTADELDNLHAWAAGDPPNITIPTHEWIGLNFRKPMKILYSPAPRPVSATPLFEALARGDVDGFVATAKNDLSPPTDDRPFFFLYARPADALRSPPLGLGILLRFIGQFVILSTVLILLPLGALRWQGLRTSGAGRAFLYFACLGAGFMLVEIGIIQRFVLFLGHQSYAIIVVLFTILLGAGAGSLWSTRFRAPASRWLRTEILALVGIIFLYTVTLPAVFRVAAGASFPNRIMISVALLAILGFLLGMPFPAALRVVHAASPPLVPWAIGVNGFASVLGASLAVPITMLLGLRVVLCIAAALYLLAMLAIPAVRAVAPVARSEPDLEDWRRRAPA